jgi:hypothetical protein
MTDLNESAHISGLEAKVSHQIIFYHLRVVREEQRQDARTSESHAGRT